MSMAVFSVWSYSPTRSFSRFSLASRLGMAHWAAESKQSVMSNSCLVWSTVFCHTCSQEAKIAQACISASQKLTFSSSLLGDHPHTSSNWLLCLGQILRLLVLKLLGIFFFPSEIKIHNKTLFSKQVAKLGLRRLQGQAISWIYYWFGRQIEFSS